MLILHKPYYTLFENDQLETSAGLFLFDFCLITINLPRLYQREANHIIAAVERLIVFGLLTYRVLLGGVLKEGAHDFFDASRLKF